MDNEFDQEEPPTEKSLIVRKNSLNEIDANRHNGHEPVATMPSVPMRPAREETLAESRLIAERRARVKRMILRKRLHGRQASDHAPRIVLSFAITLIVIFTLLSSGVGAVYAYYQSQLPLLNNMATNSLFQSTHIYDRNGKLLYTLYNHQNGYGRRTYVNYAQISPLLVDATIAAEDHSFWTNQGVDFQGILRAAYTDLANQAAVEGASTVTQQLIKNQLFNGDERTLPLKGEEALLAYGLTQQYPKWKIMEMYINTIPYGDLNYGAEAAAQDFFNLQPKCTHSNCTPALSQLDLAQASLLAGLPQSPSYYNPIYNKSAALARQQYVLQSMVDLT